MDAERDVDLIGSRVSRYAVVGLIGCGGMAKVYLGLDEQLHRHVAIKVPRESSPDRPSRALLTEARFLSRLNHKYVAAIFDFIRDAERDYIVMEFVPGPTLKEVVAAGPLPTSELLRLGVQLGRGLAAAHSARVIHRDLKPQNIKLTPSGQLKILDFGVAALLPSQRPLDSTLDTHPATLVGTVPYMSPEQLRGEELDERTDIFSAGAVLYEMAAGRAAFPQRHIGQIVDAIQHHDPPALSSVNPFVPVELELVVSRALAKDPSRRQQRAEILVAELRSMRRRRFTQVKRNPWELSPMTSVLDAVQR